MEKRVNEIDGIGAYFAPRPLITVFGVKYLHLRMNDGTDLYITEHGLPYTKCLLPENHWEDKKWMEQHSTRLPGTSAVFRVRTKQREGLSKEIIIKWNRMGQDIPGETGATGEAEFNSPFAEFSLVLELRNTRRESPGQLYTHKPLAIFVPRKYVAGERLGRKRYRMEAIKQQHHEEIDIDWNRNYAVIYEWLKGIDSVQACREGMIPNDQMSALIQRTNDEMRAKGFTVSDNKPQHIIVRPRRDGNLAKDRQGKVLYGLVDFELLNRTPEREEALRARKRQEYLVRQAHRFEAEVSLPPGLSAVNIMGVDYIFGEVESTGGKLWVVGRDPDLFEYFLPEKWRRTPRTKISATQQMFETVSKDNVHLVWRVSRVGQTPDADPFVRREARILAYGYNSPFEEFSIALQLSRQGIETTYPRAIYMTGHRVAMASELLDEGRYDSHAELVTPEGHPILSPNHEYLTIWGYWNAPDDALAERDEPLYRGIDALRAYRDKRLTQKEYFRVVRAAKKRLAAAGVEDLSLRGNHLLLSIDREERLARGKDKHPLPLYRICNFELLKRIREEAE